MEFWKQFFFSVKLIFYFVLFQMRYSTIRSGKYCYKKKNKRKKVVVTCHFFMSTTGVYSFFVSLNYIIATNCLMKNTQQLNAVLCIFDIVSSFVYSFPPEVSELEKNMQEMKRNLSALREYSVGAFFFLIIWINGWNTTLYTLDYGFQTFNSQPARSK